MRTTSSAIAIATLCLLVIAAPRARAQATAADAGIDLSPTTLLSAVRDYPPEVLDAMLELDRYPTELERLLAGGEATFEGPRQLTDAIPQGSPTGFRSAVMRLLDAPELLFIANARPEELHALRALREEAPDGFEARRRQLQAGYEAAAVLSARAWQDLLERDPVALSQYRDLLESFCRNRLELQPDFVCVDVVKREYYYACTPNEAVIAFASQSADTPAALRRALEQWDRVHGSFATDERVAALRPDERIRLDLARGSIFELPAAARSEMWRAPGAWGGVSIGRIPVAVQPAEDQPPEARLAFAIAETVRLWSLQGDPEAELPPVAEAPVDQAPEVVYDDADAWGDDEPHVIVEQDYDYPVSDVYVYEEPYVPVYSAGFYYRSHVTPYYCGPSGFFAYRSYGPRTYCSPVYVYRGGRYYTHRASAYGHSGLSVSLYGRNWGAGFRYGNGIQRYSSGAIQFNNDGRRRHYVNYGYPTRPDRTVFRDNSRRPTVIRSSPRTIQRPGSSSIDRGGTTIRRSGTTSGSRGTIQRPGSSSGRGSSAQPGRSSGSRSGSGIQRPSGSRSGSGIQRPSGSRESSSGIRPKKPESSPMIRPVSPNSGGSRGVSLWPSSPRPKSESNPMIRPTNPSFGGSRGAAVRPNSSRSSSPRASDSRSSSLVERLREASRSRASSSSARGAGISSRSGSGGRSSGSASTVRSGSRSVTRSKASSSSSSSSRSSSGASRVKSRRP